MKKIVFLLFFGLLALIGIKAQNPSIPAIPDSVNIYKMLLKDMAEKGIDIAEALKNPTLVDKLKQKGLRVDSLEYYFKLQLIESRGSVTELAGKLAMGAKAYGDSIVLRWGPTKEPLWAVLNKGGYFLERRTLIARQNLFDSIDNTSLKLLVDKSNPILPWSLEKIKSTLKPGDTLAIIATQTLYGSSFKTGMQAGNPDFTDRDEERNTRFGFSLLMADKSMQAANILGLRYVDPTAEKGKAYQYTLRSVAYPDSIWTQTFILNDPSFNQKVSNIIVREMDSQVELIWSKYENPFSAFVIERSADNGNTWVNLTPKMLVFMDNKQIKEPNYREFGNPGDKNYLRIDMNDYRSFLDSAKNDVTYTYRVKGLTPFADYTGYTSLNATPHDQTPPPSPQIVSYEVREADRIAVIKWNMDYDKELLADLSGFTMWESASPDKPFRQISDLLPPNTRSYTSAQPLEKGISHYYILKVVDKKGNTNASFPMYLHVIDDVPPAPPTHLGYTLNDTTGIVTLLWDPNTEPDLIGYRVFFSNNPANEFSQLTVSPIGVNMYRDTLELVTLSDKVYYRIQAVDNSYNRSDFSEVLEVKRPDILPPVAPVMEVPEVDGSGILVKWRPSTSEDVVKQILYRRHYDRQEEWQPMIEIPDVKQNRFRDTTTEPEQVYEFSVKAQDDANLYSDYATPVRGRSYFNQKMIAITGLSALADTIGQTVALSWNFTAPDVKFLKNKAYFFYIYKSIGTEGQELLKQLPQDQRSYTDVKVKTPGKYSYAVKVVYEDGKTSPLSNRVQVEMPQKKK